MKKKIRWGVLSTAGIATEDVIPAMQQAAHCEVATIASRSVDKASNVAKTLGIKNVAGSYEELLEMPGIDAIYNPLPNHLHVEWSLRALRAGKHVLCEKPIGLSHEDARKLADGAGRHPDLKVMEAFMYRHHPRWHKTKEIAGDGSIGRVRLVHSSFSYFNDNPEDIRNKPGMGGGALLDIGCYCISVPRYIFGEEPQNVWGFMEMDPGLHIDRLTSGVLEFPEGRATFTCATQLARHQSVTIIGTKGKMEIPSPFNPPDDRPTFINLTGEGDTTKISIPACNQYTLQGEAFSRAILDRRPVPVPLDDAMANMKVIDAVARNSNEGNKGSEPAANTRT